MYVRIVVGVTLGLALVLGVVACSPPPANEKVDPQECEELEFHYEEELAKACEVDASSIPDEMEL